MAEYFLEPWGDDWRQASTIAAEVSNSSREFSIPLDYYVPRKIRDIPQGPTEEEQIQILDSFVKDNNRQFGKA